MSAARAVLMVETPLDGGSVVRWTARDKAITDFAARAVELVVAGVALALADANIACPFVPLVAEAPDRYRVLVVGAGPFDLDPATHAMLKDGAPREASVTLAFGGPSPAPEAREGADYELVRRANATVKYLADVPAEPVAAAAR